MHACLSVLFIQTIISLRKADLEWFYQLHPPQLD